MGIFVNKAIFYAFFKPEKNVIRPVPMFLLDLRKPDYFNISQNNPLQA